MFVCTALVVKPKDVPGYASYVNVRPRYQSSAQLKKLDWANAVDGSPAPSHCFPLSFAVCRCDKSFLPNCIVPRGGQPVNSIRTVLMTFQGTVIECGYPSFVRYLKSKTFTTRGLWGGNGVAAVWPQGRRIPGFSPMPGTFPRWFSSAKQITSYVLVARRSPRCSRPNGFSDTRNGAMCFSSPKFPRTLK
jgi:hypothetical protein